MTGQRIWAIGQSGRATAAIMTALLAVQAAAENAGQQVAASELAANTTVPSTMKRVIVVSRTIR